MRILKSFLSLVLLLTTGTSLLAQEKSVKLTMLEAVHLGLENSKQLKIAENKMDEASARLGEARWHFYPEVGVSGTYLHVNSPNVDARFSGGSQDGESSMVPGNISQAALMQVSVTQPIFAGMKIRHNANSAKYMKESSDLAFEDKKDHVASEVIGDYFDLYKLRETEKLVRENLELSKERVRNFANLEKNGVISYNDLLRAQLQQSQFELTLLDIQNKIKTSNYAMTIELSLDENSIIQIDSIDTQLPVVLEDLDYYKATALKNRSDLKSSEMQEKAMDERLKAAKGNYYPSLALTGGYVNLYVPDFITVTNAVNVGVGLKYSISGIFDAHHHVAEANAIKNESEIETDILRDDIKKEIYMLYSNYEKDLKRIETVELAVKQAQENLSMRQNSYKNGLIVLDDMLEAEVQLLRNRVDLASARADAVVSYYRLLLATGTITEKLMN